MMESFQFTINHEGKDICIITDDLDAAELILNDEGAREQFLNQFDINNIEGPLVMRSEVASTNLFTSTTNTDTSISKSLANSEQIWCRKKPTERDLEATSSLLKLRQQMAANFDDRKTVKSKLWHKIALELQKSYKLGPNAAEKCRQKFANLQRAYLAYVRHQKSTGSEKNDDIPLFFEELHSILGSKAKTNPNFLEDSMGSENVVEPEQIPVESNTFEAADIQKPQIEPTLKNNPGPSTAPLSPSTESIQDRFKSVKKNLRPIHKSDIIIKELQADRKSQEQQFSFFKDHLTKTEEQRDRFLNILERTFSRKRKRGSSSDSD